MMKPRVIIILTLIFVSMSSCILRKTSNYREFSFIPSVYPYTDTIYSNHLNELPFYHFGQQNKPKILLYTNGDCSVCLAQISKWHNSIKEQENLFRDIAIAIVIQTENIHMLEYNLEKIENHLPIYIDTAKVLQIYNMIDYKSSTSFLLNQENCIIGEEIELEGYKRKIHRLLTTR